MTSSTANDPICVAFDDITITPHPEWPDNVLLALCARFKHRIVQWDTRVAAWEEAGARDERTQEELVRLKRLWEADFMRIRSIEARTAAGSAGRLLVARILIERSSAGDGEVLEFLRQTLCNHESLLEAEAIAEAKRASEDQSRKQGPSLFKRALSSLRVPRSPRQEQPDSRLPT